jgi:hypothetical protein
MFDWILECHWCLFLSSRRIDRKVVAGGTNHIVLLIELSQGHGEYGHQYAQVCVDLVRGQGSMLESNVDNLMFHSPQLLGESHRRNMPCLINGS